MRRLVMIVVPLVAALLASGCSSAAESPREAAAEYADNVEAGDAPPYGDECGSDTYASVHYKQPAHARRTIDVRRAGKDRWHATVRYARASGGSTGVSLELTIRRFGQDRYEVCP